HPDRHRPVAHRGPVNPPRLVVHARRLGHGCAGPGGEDAAPLHLAGLDRRGRQIQADVGALLPLLGGDEDTVPDDDQALRRLVRHGAEYTTSPSAPGTPGAGAPGAMWGRSEEHTSERQATPGDRMPSYAYRKKKPQNPS